MTYIDLVNKYFNIKKIESNIINKIYALFKSLLYYRHVPEKLIKKCCETGRLTELINKKLMNDDKEIYGMFIKSEINLDDKLMCTQHDKYIFEIVHIF